MAGILRLNNTGTGNGQSTITTAASGDTTYTLPSGGGTFVTTGSTEALTVPFASGTASAPSVTFIGDTNTGIYSSGADKVAITTSGTERLVVDDTGKVGVGTTSPATLFHAEGTQSSAGEGLVRIRNNHATSGQPSWGIGITRQNSDTRALLLGSDDTNDASIGVNGNNALVFGKEVTGSWSEHARIDSAGSLLVGTSTSYTTSTSPTIQPLLQIHNTNLNQAQISINSWSTGTDTGPNLSLCRSDSGTVGTHTVVGSTDVLGNIRFAGSDGGEFIEGAKITASADGTWGDDDGPTKLTFSTTADGASSPTERMRIDSAGDIFLGPSSGDGAIQVQPLENSGTCELAWDRAATASSATALRFRDGGSTKGTITYNNTSTAYNTSSDYRLKENVVPLTGATDRINQLQVHRFNFIADPDTTVDGFIAHEAQAVVPECVTGTKDEVDDEGNPVYQGIDQSKLVPLLTAALQEALQKIEDLEARLTAGGL